MSLNHYQVLYPVGKGQYGQVFKAVRKVDDLPVAIKVIAKKLNEREERMANLEISIMGKIDCPQILKLIDHFKREETFYLVLEYCSKGDLEKVCQGKKGLSQELVQLIAVELVQALVYLEEMKIAHRDIKLANIYINHNYQVKLADLGFAKMIGEDLLTSYAGTPLNMAPQIFNNGKYTNKCDIWSFGVIIYQMLYGVMPYFPKNKTLQDLIHLVNTKGVSFPKDKSMSMQAQDLILKCLQKNPNKRISASQLLKHPWITSANKKEGALEQLLSRVMFQSGLIFLEEQIQEQDQSNACFQEYRKALENTAIKYGKEFEVNVKKISSNFTECLKLMKKSPAATNALHSLVQDRIKEISCLQLEFNLPESPIKIVSEQFGRCKSAAVYLRKFLTSKYDYVPDSQMKLFRLVREEFSQYYPLVEPLQHLIETHLKPVVFQFKYYDDLDPTLTQLLTIKAKKDISKEKLIELLTKPPDKSEILLMDILKYKAIEQPSEHASLAFYLSNLKAMAELKAITMK